MSSDWIETSLGECVTFSSGNTPSKSEPSFWNGSIPWISAKDMKSFWVEDSEDHLTDAGSAVASKLVPAGTTLLLTRGMTLHNYIPIVRTRQPANFNQDVKALSPRDGVVPDYVAYLLLGNEARIQALVDSAGHGTGRLASPQLKQLPILLPPITEQLELSAFLGALDARIALLRETNATLEAMAHALFKSWFVDFDPVHAKQQGMAPEGMDEATAALFPGSFEESELGLVPKEWQIVTLADLCTFQKGCSYKGDGLSDDQGAYMFNLGCFNAPRVFATEKVKRYLGEFKPRHAVESGDLIIANTDMTQDRAILGRPLFVPSGFTPGFVSHHVFKVDLVAGLTRALRPFLFFAFHQPFFRERAVGYATGTTVLALPKDALEKHQIILPNDRLVDSFAALCAPLLASIETNLHRIETLRGIRDSLLPRLICGQLRLPDAEILDQ